MKIRLTALAVMLLPAVLVSGCGQAGFDAELNKIVEPYRFDLFDWELGALSGEVNEMFSGSEEVSADDSATVLQYFDLRVQIYALEGQITAVDAGMAEGDIQALESELAALEQQADALQPAVERIIEAQIRRTLDELGIYNPTDDIVGLEVGFPPVNFVIEAPPRVLVVSPRDEINSIREITLVADMTAEEVEAIEDAVAGLDVSALVIQVGGMATYPAFVTTSTNLRFTINAAVEEWLHQYLFFKPLGFLYGLDQAGISRDYDIAVMNETLAGIVSDEIGETLYQEYYAGYEEEASVEAVADENAFDFNLFMRQTRQQVDAYLEAGEIEAAEEYMQQQRQYLLTQGYYIRKLNQAYFAFYGTYASSPTSVDPIGDDMRALRAQYGSLVEFLDAADGLTSRQQLSDMLEVDSD